MIALKGNGPQISKEAKGAANPRAIIVCKTHPTQICSPHKEETTHSRILSVLTPKEDGMLFSWDVQTLNSKGPSGHSHFFSRYQSPPSSSTSLLSAKASLSSILICTGVRPNDPKARNRGRPPSSVLLQRLLVSPSAFEKPPFR